MRNIPWLPIFLSLRLLILMPLCLFILLAAYSFLLHGSGFGWNGFTLFLFWFIFLPAALFFLSKLFGIKRTWQTAVAMVCFYGWVVFMIYKHYATDYFLFMMISCAYNLVIMGLVMFIDLDDSEGVKQVDQQ